MNLFSSIILTFLLSSNPVFSECVDKECAAIKHKKLIIKKPEFRSLKGAQAASAYLIIENTGKTDDELLAVRLDSGLANSTELHQHIEKDGIMKMRAIEKIEIKAGSIAELKPKHDHIMLMGIKDKLHKLDEIKMTLVFKKAGDVTARFKRISDNTSCNCSKTKQ